MKINYDSLKVTIAKIRHSSRRRVRNDEKLLDGNMPNDDFIPFVDGTSGMTSIYDGQLPDYGKLSHLCNELSPG